MTSPLRAFGAAVCRDQEFAERLWRALEPYTFDGHEIDHAIAAETRGLENEVAGSNLRHAAVSQFHDCVPRDAVIEVVDKLRENGGLA
jgi:hypothetical protein